MPNYIVDATAPISCGVPETTVIAGFLAILPREENIRYGLRHFDNGHEVRLLQIGGGGRVLLGMTLKRWCGPPKGVSWEVYPAHEGQTYPSREEAAAVVKSLTR